MHKRMQTYWLRLLALALTLTLLAALCAGCAQEQAETPDEAETADETQTPEESEEPEEPKTPDETDTPDEGEAQTPDDDASEAFPPQELGEDVVAALAAGVDQPMGYYASFTDLTPIEITFQTEPPYPIEAYQLERDGIFYEIVVYGSEDENEDKTNMVGIAGYFFRDTDEVRESAASMQERNDIYGEVNFAEDPLEPYVRAQQALRPLLEANVTDLYDLDTIFYADYETAVAKTEAKAGEAYNINSLFWTVPLGKMGTMDVEYSFMNAPGIEEDAEGNWLLTGKMNNVQFVVRFRSQDAARGLGA